MEVLLLIGGVLEEVPAWPFLIVGEKRRRGKEMTTPKEVLEQALEKNVKVVDFKFVDLPGTWQHLSISADKLTEALFEEGIPFDGSSIRGFQPIHESDMLVIPDANTAFIDPFMSEPTLSLTCNIVHPTKEPYTRDPRYVARKAENFLRKSGVAEAAYFGPEAEFYIFDSVRYTSSVNIQFAQVDSLEAHWNSGGPDDEPNLGHFMNLKGGYFPVPPDDTYQNLRTKMMLTLKDLGIPVDGHHHEVGASGQAEIRFHFSTLVDTADRLLLYKYVTRNIARNNDKTVTFMPKPVLGDNGSGMHIHQSLWKNERPLFYDPDDGYAGISQLARFYIGGILRHTPAILGIAAPSTNSYKRLVPGFEAPVNLVFSKGNRSVAVRIPLTSDPKAKRIEFRPPDPTANPYLLFSALLMAGLDGIKQKMDPSDKDSEHYFGPIDSDLFNLSAKEREELKIRSVPRSLEEALDELEKDHAFLLEGDVFTSDLIEKYIEVKREEVDRVRMCPVPIEFLLYYGA
jgi:glutamine synthetase